MAPSSSSMTTTSSSPFFADSPANFLATWPLVKGSSSPSRFRLPVAAVPFVTLATSGSGMTDFFGLRGISRVCSSETGFVSLDVSVLDCGCQHPARRVSNDTEGCTYLSTIQSSRLTRGSFSTSSSSMTVKKLSLFIPSSDSFLGRLSSISGS